MFRALTRMTLLVIAPSAPVAWSPGATPLSESLRSRVRAGAGAAAERALAVMPASGRRVVAIPLETAMRHVGGVGTHPRRVPEQARVPVAARVRVPVVGPRDMGTGAPSRARVPWDEPVPVSGVTVRTSQVPTSWLRPTAPSPVVAPRPLVPTPVVPTSVATTPVVLTPLVPTPVVPTISQAQTGSLERGAPGPTTVRRDERPVPASTRLRRAAMMAFGLLVSVVAVEAAARVGRR